MPFGMMTIVMRCVAALEEVVIGDGMIALVGVLAAQATTEAVLVLIMAVQGVLFTLETMVSLMIGAEVLIMVVIEGEENMHV